MKFWIQTLRQSQSLEDFRSSLEEIRKSHVNTLVMSTHYENLLRSQGAINALAEIEKLVSDELNSKEDKDAIAYQQQYGTKYPGQS